MTDEIPTLKVGDLVRIAGVGATLRVAQTMSGLIDAPLYWIGQSDGQKVLASTVQLVEDPAMPTQAEYEAAAAAFRGTS